MHDVQKAGLYSLVALVVFALVFAFLPGSERASSQTGAALRDVQLTLYPARDSDAVWQFQAANVTNDPLTSVTELSGLSAGKRLVRAKDSAGHYTGVQTLDATLVTPHLTIDAQDNLMTTGANITLVQQCAAINLTGTPAQPVKIEQGAGFSAPLAVVDSPALAGRVTNLRMTFDFVVEGSGADSSLGWNPDAKQTCKNGRRMPV